MPKDTSKKDALSDTENDNGARKKGSKRDFWNTADLACLIKTLKDEKKLGRQAESGWSSESYTAVVMDLKAAGTTRSLKQVKSCWTRVCCVFFCFY
jgi:hypothetical protein